MFTILVYHPGSLESFFLLAVPLFVENLCLLMQLIFLEKSAEILFIDKITCLPWPI